MFWSSIQDGDTYYVSDVILGFVDHSKRSRRENSSPEVLACYKESWTDTHKYSLLEPILKIFGWLLHLRAILRLKEYRDNTGKVSAIKNRSVHSSNLSSPSSLTLISPSPLSWLPSPPCSSSLKSTHITRPGSSLPCEIFSYPKDLLLPWLL